MEDRFGMIRHKKSMLQGNIYLEKILANKTAYKISYGCLEKFKDEWGLNFIYKALWFLVQ